MWFISVVPRVKGPPVPSVRVFCVAMVTRQDFIGRYYTMSWVVR